MAVPVSQDTHPPDRNWNPHIHTHVYACKQCHGKVRCSPAVLPRSKIPNRVINCSISMHKVTACRTLFHVLRSFHFLLQGKMSRQLRPILWSYIWCILGVVCLFLSIKVCITSYGGKPVLTTNLGNEKVSAAPPSWPRLWTLTPDEAHKALIKHRRTRGTKRWPKTNES